MATEGHGTGRRVAGRRAALLGLALLPVACAGIPPGEAARLALDGERATGRLLEDLALAERRVDHARDLLLMRAALALPPGTDAEALRARPEVAAADAQLAGAAAILAQGHSALEGLRDSYRAFGHVAAGRDPESFDAMLDRASEDAEALRTLIERYARDGSELVEELPGGGAILGVARLTGGLVSRGRAARRLVDPNDALIELLNGLLEASQRESAALGLLLARVARDRGEDVGAALRRSGIARTRATATLEDMAESFGWRVSPFADDRLREARSGRIALGLRAVRSRRAAPVPARMLDPEAGRAVLAALRDRHLELRGRARPDPDALRDSLHRLAR